MRPNFEDWAQSKRFKLERKPNDQYEDPTTQFAWECYMAACNDCQRIWQPRYENAMKFVLKTGIRIKEFEEELKRREELWTKLFPK